MYAMFYMGIQGLGMFLDRTGKKRITWIVLARFRCIRFINDCRNLSKDKSTENQCRIQLRENNVSFGQVFRSDCASELKGYRIVAVKALQNVDVGEELYIYHFYECSFL